MLNYTLVLFQLFAQLDVCRADEEESLREVAISAMAIDKMIGEDTKEAKTEQVWGKGLG